MDECKFSDDLIFQYIRGELSPADEEIFELHCLECEVCLDQVVFLRTLGKALEGKRPLVMKMVIKNYFKKFSELKEKMAEEIRMGLESVVQPKLIITKDACQTEKTIFDINLTELDIKKFGLVSEIKDSEKELVLEIGEDYPSGLIAADAFILVVSTATLDKLFGTCLSDEVIEQKLQKLFSETELTGILWETLKESTFKVDGNFELNDSASMIFRCHWGVDEYREFLKEENKLVFVIY